MSVIRTLYEEFKSSIKAQGVILLNYIFLHMFACGVSYAGTDPIRGIKFMIENIMILDLRAEVYQRIEIINQKLSEGVSEDVRIAFKARLDELQNIQRKLDSISENI